jgi:hypothetical protein
VVEGPADKTGAIGRVEEEQDEAWEEFLGNLDVLY